MTIASLVVLILAFFACRALFRVLFPPTVYCVTCGTTGSRTTNTRGNLLIEIILWFFFIVPGVIYSLWRLTTVRKVCRACGSDQIIPPSSPRATAEAQRLVPPPLPPPLWKQQ